MSLSTRSFVVVTMGSRCVRDNQGSVSKPHPLFFLRPFWCTYTFRRLSFGFLLNHKNMLIYLICIFVIRSVNMPSYLLSADV